MTGWLCVCQPVCLPSVCLLGQLPAWPRLASCLLLAGCMTAPCRCLVVCVCCVRVWPEGRETRVAASDPTKEKESKHRSTRTQKHLPDGPVQLPRGPLLASLRCYRSSCLCERAREGDLLATACLPLVKGQGAKGMQLFFDYVLPMCVFMETMN